MAPLPDRAERLAASRSRPLPGPRRSPRAPAPRWCRRAPERNASPARSPRPRCQAGLAVYAAPLQVVLGNRAVQRLVQSPQAQAAPSPRVQRAEPRQEARRERRGRSEGPAQRGGGTGCSGGAGGTRGVPRLAPARGGAGSPTPRRSTSRCPRLGGGTPPAVRRNRRCQGLRPDSEAEHQEGAAPGVNDHPPGPRHHPREDRRRAGREGWPPAAQRDQTPRRRDQGAAPRPRRGDKAQLAERVERQLPELFVARARQIALVILTPTKPTSARGEPLRGVSEQATGAPPPEVDGLASAPTGSWSPWPPSCAPWWSASRG